MENKYEIFISVDHLAQSVYEKVLNLKTMKLYIMMIIFYF